MDTDKRREKVIRFFCNYQCSSALSVVKTPVRRRVRAQDNLTAQAGTSLSRMIKLVAEATQDFGTKLIEMTPFA